ncbi:PREDICTED: uncharacterized protein LOC104590069 [Nelumbo nucifera]|uniref:Uncharacterized protein LOC104590069 n=1 Tax=Nelumbo nucifera TaxID=4432 RepID=A0A1U7Z7I8_NELNU|nr:PREDICTED: uncharacterized protein LOC104590069 [Nelumbo nucifera]
MAEFPPNLDDGELWIPSDIFPDEVSTKFSPEFPSEITYMEDLAHQLATFALLERNQTVANPPPNLPPNLEYFRRQGRYGAVAPPRTGFSFGFGRGPTAGHHLFSSGNEGFPAGSRPVYQYRPMKPVHAQVESSVHQPGDRSLQKQQQNQGQNRFLPFQVNGSGMGGLVREYGGTGVFLPRIATTADVKKKQSGKTGEENQQKSCNKKVALEKQEAFQLSSEMGLPQDWTY